MPTYDYRCDCGRESEVVKRMNDPDPMCECGLLMKQVFLCPRMIDQSFIGSTKMPGYYCVASDQYVSSTHQRREIIKRHNLIEKG